VQDIVNMAAVAVVDAQERSGPLDATTHAHDGATSPTIFSRL
jgi:hypothetical protein